MRLQPGCLHGIYGERDVRAEAVKRNYLSRTVYDSGAFRNAKGTYYLMTKAGHPFSRSVEEQTA